MRIVITIHQSFARTRTLRNNKSRSARLVSLPRLGSSHLTSLPLVRRLAAASGQRVRRDWALFGARTEGRRRRWGRICASRRCPRRTVSPSSATG